MGKVLWRLVQTFRCSLTREHVQEPRVQMFYNKSASLVQQWHPIDLADGTCFR